MCCGVSSSKKANPVTVQSQPTQQAAVVQMPTPQSITSNPTVIPKAIKQQLIVNQQFAHIPKKT